MLSKTNDQRSRDVTDDLHILVLGDSTLSGLGCVLPDAIEHLSHTAYNRRLIFHNAAVPGMTSADALIHYTEQARRVRFAAVILQLGNCDACAFGLPKRRRALHWASMTRRIVARRIRGSSDLSRRNAPFTYVRRSFRSQRLKRSVTPKDFSYFIRRIVSAAANVGTKSIVIVSDSKYDFPPCNNIGNFLFYRLIGVTDQLQFSNCGSMDSRLLKALRHDEAGKTAAALESYENIARDAADTETVWIALNNRAVLLSSLGRQAEALECLSLIPERKNPMFPIVLFNQAAAAQRLGSEAGLLLSKELLDLARESDSASYRITNLYRSILLQDLKDSAAIVIDSRRIVGQVDFVDYCHPTIHGQARIGDRIRSELSNCLAIEPGEHRAVVSCIAANPDRYCGYTSSLFAHFGIVKDNRNHTLAATQHEYEDYRSVLARSRDITQPASQRTLWRLVSHPLFGMSTFLDESVPDCPVDQGGLPELYFMRHMMAMLEDVDLVSSEFAEYRVLRPYWPRTTRIRHWWGSLGEAAPLISADALRSLVKKMDSEVVLYRAETRFADIVNHEPSVFDKYRTITYWFLRESLLFGSTSHYSMYCDRAGMLDVASTCFALMWADRPSRTVRTRIETLLAKLCQLAQIHREYLHSYAHQLHRMPSSHITSYTNAIQALT